MELLLNRLHLQDQLLQNLYKQGAESKQGSTIVSPIQHILSTKYVPGYSGKSIVIV